VTAIEELVRTASILSATSAQIRAGQQAITIELTDEYLTHLTRDRFALLQKNIRRFCEEAPAHGLVVSRSRDDVRMCEVFTIGRAEEGT
jgi:hypothetical protein